MLMLILDSMPKIIFIFCWRVYSFKCTGFITRFLTPLLHYTFHEVYFMTKYSVKNDRINKLIYYIQSLLVIQPKHVDVIKWKHFPRYWRFVRGIHRSPVNSLHKGQWCGASVFSLICAWENGWVNNREAGDLRRHRTHYDVIVMKCHITPLQSIRIYSLLLDLRFFYWPVSTQFRWMERNLTRRETSCGILQGSVFAPFAGNPNMEPLEGNHPCHNMPA